MTTYSWDPFDQLLEVDDGSSPIAYNYDALGRRAERTESGTSETAHYGDLSDIATIDTDGTGIVESFVSGAGGLVEQRAGSQTSFPLADAHGDVLTVADSAGAVGSRQSYDPWGKQLAGPTIEMGWLGAQERRFDPATDLIQMGIRPYSPEAGRFVGEDPIFGHLGVGGSHDRYAYAWDNPVNYYDLGGRDTCPDFLPICPDGDDPVTSLPATESVAGDAVDGVSLGLGALGTGLGLGQGCTSLVPEMCEAPINGLQDFLKDVPDDVKDFALGCAIGGGTTFLAYAESGVPILVPGFGAVSSGFAGAVGCAIGGGGVVLLGYNPVVR